MEIRLRRGDIQRMWASPLFLVCKRSRALAIRLWGGTSTRHAIPFNPAADVLEVNLRTPPFVYSPPGQAQAGAGWYMIPPPPQCHLCGNRRLRDAKRGNQLMDIPLTFVDSDNYLGMHGLSDHRASSLFLSRVRKVRVYIPRSNDEGDAANHHPEGWTRYRKVNWYDQVLGHLFLYFPSLETLEISVEKRWDDTVGKCFAFSGQGTGNITQDWDVYDFRALGLLEALERLSTNPILEGKEAKLKNLVFNLWGAHSPNDKPGEGTTGKVGQDQTWNFTEAFAGNWKAHLVLFPKGEEDPRTERGVYRLP